MTRRDGVGFRTFEELVTTPAPDGLGYPNYAKFRGIAISEPGIMNEREYDLLTASPEGKGGADKTPLTGSGGLSPDKSRWLRAIARADPLVRRLFVADLIDLKLAALMGRDDPKAGKALAAIRSLSRNGDDAAYRRQVNRIIREAFAKAPPSPLDRVIVQSGRHGPRAGESAISSGPSGRNSRGETTGNSPKIRLGLFRADADQARRPASD